MARLNAEENAREVRPIDVDGNSPKFNADGSQNVVPLVNPPAPANTTPVVSTGFGSVASTAGVDTNYTIPNGETLTIQVLLAGAEANTGGSVVDLFEDPNGDLSVLNRIANLYVDGSSDNAPLQRTFAGDGTRRIVLRRRGFSSNGREMFAQWSGYTQ
jgi:hypothetical protein